MQIGNNYAPLAVANQTVNLKSGPGVLHTITSNEAGAVSVTVYDGLNGSGAVIAVIDTGARATFIFDVAFTAGLSIVIGAGGGLDVTVSYK